jgi:hypothetical protein
MAEPPDLLDPQPIVLVERAYDEMWETINEVRRNDPPLWVCQQIDALILDAAHAIASMRPDNPALKHIFLLAGAFLMKKAQGVQHAEALADREAQHAEALAEREAKEAERQRARTSKATKQRSGTTPGLDPIIRRIKSLGLSNVELIRKSGPDLMQMVGVAKSVDQVNRARRAVLRRPVRRRSKPPP